MTEEKRPFWARTLNSVQDFVGNPETKKWSKLGSRVIEVAAHLGQAQARGPVAIAGGAIGLLNILSNEEGDSIRKRTIDTAQKEGYKFIDTSGIINMIFERNLLKDPKILIREDSKTLVSYTVTIRKKEYDIILALDQEGKPAIYYDGVVSQELTTELMAEMLWSDIGNAASITLQQREWGPPMLTAEEIPDFSVNKYIGPFQPEKFIEKFDRYKEAGLKRAYLLIGPPGTGKTTFSFKCAELLGGRMLIVTPELLSSKASQNQILALINTFKPNVLLFEDVDRNTNKGFLLSLMEFIRINNPETLMLSTANWLGLLGPALRRPGRLGPIINFNAPDDYWKKELIKLYSEKLKLDKDITGLVKFMDHPRFTHDYIREVCEQAMVEDYDELLKYIKETVAALKKEFPVDEKKDASKKVSTA